MIEEYNNIEDITLSIENDFIRGEKGEKGDKGDKGDKGEQGIQGEKGDKGDAFTYEDFTQEQLMLLKGDKGDTGEQGEQGERGFQGEKGDKGDKGEQGDVSLEQIQTTKVVENKEIIIEDACPTNSHLKIWGKTKQGENIELKNLYNNKTATNEFINNNGEVIQITEQKLGKVSDYIPVEGHTIYTFSGYDINTHNSTDIYMCEYDNNKNFIQKNLLYKYPIYGTFRIECTFEQTTIRTKFVRIGYIQDSDRVMNNIQFEEGEQATDYEEYISNIPNPDNIISIRNIKDNINFTKENENSSISETIIFPLEEGQVLHKGDYLAEDGIHQNRKQIQINTTNFNIAMPWEGLCIVMSKTTGITLDYINLEGLCTHFENAKNSNIVDNTTANQYLNNNQFCFRNSNTKDRIYFKNSNFTNLEDWQNFFNNNEVIIEYEVKEIIIPYKEEQQTAYNKLRLMYEGYNKITCTNEIKPNLEYTYYYNNDLNKTYAKRFDKVEKNIEELEKVDIDLSNQIKELLKQEHFEILDLKASNSWDELVTKGSSSIASITGGSMTGIGAPTEAYSYGLLITINPKHSTSAIYSTTQIYVTDSPNNIAGGNRGIYIRTSNKKKWLKITGTEVNGVSE